MISLTRNPQRRDHGLDLRLAADEVTLLLDALHRAANRLDTYVRVYPQGKKSGAYQKQADRMREIRARLLGPKPGAAS